MDSFLSYSEFSLVSLTYTKRLDIVINVHRSREEIRILGGVQSFSRIQVLL